MTKLPRKGLDKKELLQAMDSSKSNDVNWRQGRSWSLVYYGGEEHTEFLSQAYRLFFSENGLSPKAFPSLYRFETDIIRILAELLHGDEQASGTMTSGGTESILLSVKAHRDYYRAVKPGVVHPEMVLPATAHPAFFKAAEYFDVKAVPVPVGSAFRADPGRMADACSENTILIGASAPSFPQGVVDPIDQLGELAQKLQVGLHIDACLGGFILPFLEMMGRRVRPFDFRVPGVTSISADLHKYGFAAKGASAVLYRDPELRKRQYFVYPDWPGGVFASPSMTGTRPGGAIAAAWAGLMSLGQEGYLDLCRRIMSLTDRIVSGLSLIPGLELMGEPDMSVLSFTSTEVDIFAVADLMAERGWHIDRQNNPDSLHLIVTPNHEQAVEPFLEDLRWAVGRAGEIGLVRSSQRRGTLYGVTQDLPNSENSKRDLLDSLDSTFLNTE